jgi:predicted metalloprotease with PDZ domain
MQDKKSTKIYYYIEFKDPETHYIKITINFNKLNFTEEYTDLVLPVWRSGRYLIFDFASGVRDFSAFSGNGEQIKWHKTDKSTWRVYNDKTDFSVSYLIYANEFGTRTKGFDSDHAFINGMSAFMYSEKFRNEPVSLKIEKYSGWHVTTGLEKTDNDTLAAPDYDYLVDCPLEIGNQKDYEFYVNGKKHIISFFGEAEYDIEKLIKEFSMIIKKNHEFWGSIPYEKYVFIIHCTPVSGGGTEHINSTVVGAKPTSFESDQNIRAFLRLISHEFFHTWNVKQLKPAGLTPYDYTKENYTSELWIAEGGTSYYDGLMLTRTGQMTIDDFFKEIISGVDEDRRRPGNKVQSVADSSFDAWVKFWRRCPDAYIAESDYYAKGSYVCLILDLEIRNATVNRYSLDNVLKVMYERYPLDVKGYTNSDFMGVCGEFTGTNFENFFKNYVYGTSPIDWEKYLLYAGLELVSAENNTQPVLGLFPSKKEDKIVIENVMTGSPADKYGMKKGDEIAACDGAKMSYEGLDKKIKEMKTGDSISFAFFRRNKLLKVSLVFEERSTVTYKINKTENPTKLQKDIFEKWLEIKW